MKHLLFYNIPKSINSGLKFQKWYNNLIIEGKRIAIKVMECDKELNQEYKELNAKRKTKKSSKTRNRKH